MGDPVSLEILAWVIGGVIAYITAIHGVLWWRMNRIDGDVRDHDKRMRDGITYDQADTLIDLKLKPIADALERNTEATKQLTRALLEAK